MTGWLVFVLTGLPKLERAEAAENLKRFRGTGAWDAAASAFGNSRGMNLILETRINRSGNSKRDLGMGLTRPPKPVAMYANLPFQNNFPVLIFCRYGAP